MFDKTKIFNLSLAALFLQKRLTNADTDKSTEALTLNNFWDVAYESALEDMDLDSTSQTIALEQVGIDPSPFWRYAYKYPVNAVLIRRIVSNQITDDEETLIDKVRAVHAGESCILTNEPSAKVEFIAKDIPMAALTAQAAIYISLKLAQLSVPLIVGKNSVQISQGIDSRLELALMDAKRRDAQESSIFQPDWAKSSLLKARLG